MLLLHSVKKLLTGDPLAGLELGRQPGGSSGPSIFQDYLDHAAGDQPDGQHCILIRQYDGNIA